MKPKLSRFAIPYVVWMALFVVAPIVLAVVYAFSSDESVMKVFQVMDASGKSVGIRLVPTFLYNQNPKKYDHTATEDRITNDNARN